MEEVEIVKENHRLNVKTYYHHVFIVKNIDGSWASQLSDGDVPGLRL